jgi:hypothetical protein
MTDTFALAARAAEKLEGTCDGLEDLVERDAEIAEVADLKTFLQYLDTMVFCCVSCNWWYRQRENATPDGAEWECHACHINGDVDE